MSNKVVIDDSNQVSGNQTAVEPIVYEPAQSWRLNVICGGCNVAGEAALGRLRSTVYSGTWTLGWWEPDRPVLSANLRFEGTSVAAYFILLSRSRDSGSSGNSTLRFLVDNVERSVLPVRRRDFTFGADDFTPRTMLFQAADLEPKAHSLSVEWTHGGNGPRPAVSVALDSIEYTPIDPSRPTSRSKTTVIVAIVVPIVVLLFLLGIFFLWWRRRKAEKRRRAEAVDMTEGESGHEAMAATLSHSRSDSHVQPFILGRGGGERPGRSKEGPARGAQDTLEAGLPPSYQDVLTLSDGATSAPTETTSSGKSRIR